jgi:WhiB family transcriptional regulator, redox-sensing transcriptional regulator
VSAQRLTASVELRLLDPGGEHLAFTWQVHRDGRLLAHGQVAGAPNTPELAGWRYEAFREAAQAAIDALKDLEAAAKPSPSGDRHGPATTEHQRTCDFCAGEPAAWRYPARPDAVGVRVEGVLVLLHGGDWYACPACYQLAEAGHWDTLSDRARLPVDQGAALWATFRASRTGPGRPLNPGVAPMRERTWRDRAACRRRGVDPEVFFPEKGGSARPAKRICRQCPVRADCLAYAIATRQQFGIWGGLSQRERQRLRERPR